MVVTIIAVLLDEIMYVDTKKTHIVKKIQYSSFHFEWKTCNNQWRVVLICNDAISLCKQFYIYYI
jgi:hypothetical protein